MRITEIHGAIQGETGHAGRLCALVRLAGCDLACSYCDARYAAGGGHTLEPHAVVAEVGRLGLPLVLVTGGEPLLQEETPDLCRRLLEAGHEVMLETSGAYDVSPLPGPVARVVDVKSPGSGESHRTRWSNLALLGPRDAVKLVLCDRRDYEWARGVIGERLRGSAAEVLLSPVHRCLDPRELVAWMLEDRLPARLNLQVHKYVYGEDATGV